MVCDISMTNKRIPLSKSLEVDYIYRHEPLSVYFIIENSFEYAFYRNFIDKLYKGSIFSDSFLIIEVEEKDEVAN